MRDIYKLMLILSAVAMCDGSHAWSLGGKSKEEKERIKAEKIAEKQRKEAAERANKAEKEAEKQRKEAAEREKKAELDRIAIEKQNCTLLISENETINTGQYSKREYVDRTQKNQFIYLDWTCGMQNVSKNAFGECPNLKSVVIRSDKLETIGELAFQGCDKLEELDLSGCKNLKKIDSHAFAVCRSLKVINLPQSLERIESYAFGGCNSLKEVKLGKNVSTIGECAFISCIDLNTVNLSECKKLNQIGNNAFKGCKSLAEVKLNAATHIIGVNAFYGCESLVTIDLGNVTDVQSSAFSKCYKLTKIIDSKNLRAVGYGAFKDCALLNISTLSPITIDELAFSGCSTLSSITLTNTKSIGKRAFENCSGLMHVNLENTGIETLPTGVFSKCSKLQIVELPFSLKVISDEAFINCMYLQTVKGFLNVQKIGKNAFKNCASFYFEKFSDDLLEIEDNAFENCKSLTLRTFPEKITNIGKEAFKNTGIIDLTILMYATKIGEACFADCSKLVNVQLPKITSIPSSLFKGCNSLKTVNAPADQHVLVNTIGASAFEGCINLCNLSMPYDENLKIEKRAFADCKSLQLFKWQAVYGFRPTEIYDEAFKGCEKLKEIDISKVKTLGHEVFSGCDALTMFSNDSAFPHVDEIGKKMFAKCKIKSIKMPDTVTKIHDNAFRDCTSLTSSIISNKVTSIGKRAYSGCKNLESILLPVKLEVIGAEAFNECEKLKSITIPAGVRDIGSLAFSGCSGIESVTCSVDNYKIVIDAIDCIHETVKSVVIVGGKNSSDYNIDDALFLNSLSPEKLHIYSGNLYPVDVEELKINMLSAAANFEKIRLKGDNLKKIGPMAFYGMSKLKSVELPKNVESIDNNAFKGCDNLSEIIVPEAAYNNSKAAFEGFKKSGTSHLIHKKFILRK